MTNAVSDAFRDALPKLVRTLQIIVAVLVLGCVNFLAVVLFITSNPGPQKNGQSALPLPVVLGVVLIAVVARLFVPRAITSASIRKIADGTWKSSVPRLESAKEQTLVDQFGHAARLWYVYMTKTIIGAALLEGAAFLTTIAYMLDQSQVALVFAVVLIVGVAIHFPTIGGVCRWIESQMRLIEEQRQMSGLKA